MLFFCYTHHVFADPFPACGSYIKHLPDAKCLGFNPVVQHAH